MEFVAQSPKLPNVVAVPFNPSTVSPLLEHLSQTQKQLLATPGLLPLAPGAFHFGPLTPMFPLKVNTLLQPMPAVQQQAFGVPSMPVLAALHQQQSRAHAASLQTTAGAPSMTPLVSHLAFSPSTSPLSLDADEKSLEDELSPSAQEESSVTADESSVSHSHPSYSYALNPTTSFAASSSSSEEDDKDKQFSDTECEMASFLSTLAAALPPRDVKKKPHKINLAKPDFDFAIKKRAATKTGRPKESHVCPNCYVTESTLWRNCTVNGKSLYFCNACGLRYKKGKYCGLCSKVYYDADTNHRDWKQCSYCLNWTHKSCLHEQGQSAACDEAYPYTCTACAARDY